MTGQTNYPQAVPQRDVVIDSGFWGERQAVNRSHILPTIYHQMEITGRLASWHLDKEQDKRKYRSVVYMFWDSDTGKWLEAVGNSLATHPDPELQRQADEIIDLIEQAQQPDGYLNTYFTVIEPELKWKNLRDWHEMYNAGHMIEGAVAYYQATGKRKLLDVLCRFADHIDTMFGPGENQKHGYPGHPELELALVKLYHATGEKRYLNLAKYFIDERGKKPHYFDLEARERGDDPAKFWATTYRYCQADEPIREQTMAVGHSVRACYLYAGVADVALETGDAQLLDVSRRLWDDLTQHQMYITGGLGPAHSNEGFTFAYDLPNETAYAETCASLALIFWAQRMFHLDPNGRYIDVLERALYNTALSGVSYQGDQFFYANPLAAYPNVTPMRPISVIGEEARHYRRTDWFECPCCPPNLSRTVGTIQSYFYSTTPERLYVHLYSPNKAHFDFAGGHVHIEQQTNYPWDGDVHITVESEQSVPFEMALRIPGWCRQFSIAVNGETQTVQPQNGYAVISRRWQSGDRVSLMLEMPVERVAAHPLIRQDAGQVALQRGPLVYCIEEVDNGKLLQNVILPEDAPLNATFLPDLFGGVTVITGEALRREPESWSGEAYLPASTLKYRETKFPMRAIPYYLWANREQGEMRVWIRES